MFFAVVVQKSKAILTVLGGTQTTMLMLGLNITINNTGITNFVDIITAPPAAFWVVAVVADLVVVATSV